MATFYACVFFSNPNPVYAQETTVYAINDIKLEAKDKAAATVQLQAMFQDSVLVDDVGGLDRIVPYDENPWVSRSKISFTLSKDRGEAAHS